MMVATASTVNLALSANGTLAKAVVPLPKSSLFPVVKCFPEQSRSNWSLGAVQTRKQARKFIPAMATASVATEVATEVVKTKTDSKAGGGGFLLGPPNKVVLQTEGGSISVWSGSALLEQAEKYAMMLTLEPSGMLLPRVSEYSSIFYITRGAAEVGLIRDSGIPTNTSQVKEGDVLAVPKGYILTLLNKGSSKFEAVAVSDVSNGLGYDPLGAFIVGDGSILQGFTPEGMSTSWKLSVPEIGRTTHAQTQGGIVKVKDAAKIESLVRRENPLLDLIELAPLGPTKELLIRDFTSPISTKKPLVSNKHGAVRAVNNKNMKILDKVGMSANHVILQKDVVLSPKWDSVASILAYFTKGGGSVQLAWPGGSQDVPVKEGDLLVVPRGCFNAESSGPDGMQYAGFISEPMPSITFMAGLNSVYKSFSKDALTAAFKLPEKDVDKILNSQKAVGIFAKGDTKTPKVITLTRQRIIGLPTAPGPNFTNTTPMYDGTFTSIDFHRTLGHLINDILLGVPLVLFWSDPRVQFVLMLKITMVEAIWEHASHFFTRKLHSIHKWKTPFFTALVSWFLVTGGAGPVLAGPRDGLFYTFVYYFTIFLGGTVLETFITFFGKLWPIKAPDSEH